jgi:hypothetical protein
MPVAISLYAAPEPSKGFSVKIAPDFCNQLQLSSAITNMAATLRSLKTFRQPFLLQIKRYG